MHGEYVNCYPSANHFPSCNILIIADSRGHDLDTYLSEILKCNFRIVTCRGADLLSSIDRAKGHLTDEKWSQIYCVAGICGLTHKNRVTRAVSLRSNDPELAAMRYSCILDLAKKKLIKHLRSTDCKIIFGPITGMSLSMYNRFDQDKYLGNLQSILNTSIKLINREIVKKNENNAVSTPWLNRLVHRRHRKTYMNSYHRLQVDGCHLSPEVKEAWAKALKNAIINNFTTR